MNKLVQNIRRNSYDYKDSLASRADSKTTMPSVIIFGVKYLYGKRNQNCEIRGSTTPGAIGVAKYTKKPTFQTSSLLLRMWGKTVTMSMKPSTKL